MKKLVLASLMTAAALSVLGAGLACHRNWGWLEEHHLAGLAALEVFFLAVSVVFAAVTLQSEWATLSPGGVAQGYLLAFALMAAACFAVCVGLLVLGWLWTFGTALIYIVFTRHPFAVVGSIAAVFAIVWGWSRLHPGTRMRLVERLPWRRDRPSNHIVTDTTP